VSWDKRLDRPVVLPDGKTLRTLDDARRHILALVCTENLNPNVLTMKSAQ